MWAAPDLSKLTKNKDDWVEMKHPESGKTYYHSPSRRKSTWDLAKTLKEEGVGGGGAARARGRVARGRVAALALAPLMAALAAMTGVVLLRRSRQMTPSAGFGVPSAGPRRYQG